MLQTATINSYNANTSIVGYKKSEILNSQANKCNSSFTEILDNCTKEKQATPIENTTTTSVDIKTLKLVHIPAKNAQEAQANLELLKQKKASGEEITEDDVIKCMDHWQYSIFQAHQQFADWYVGENAATDALNSKVASLRASGNFKLNNADTMSCFMELFTYSFQNSGGQPANIVEFDRGLMNLSKELYSILKK